ncbi:MAG: sugar phosphate isomerase/epimerase [Ruminococcaceae bacterium]|nr:sugar phosphate isomerase/epimerase [Oscillospiraceae bacterium]
MKISVTSYSFQQYLNSGKIDHLGMIDKAHEIGIEGIEFTPLPGETFDERSALAKKLCERAEAVGMPIVSYTVNADLYKGSDEANAVEVARLKEQLDIAAILGAPTMRHDVCWSVPKTGAVRSFDAMLPTLAKSAREITEYAATLGIRTCSENHGLVAQDSDRMERLFNAVGHENYGLLVDIGNFVCVDEDNVTAVSRVAPYAIHVHAKDFYLSREKKEGWGVSRGCNYWQGAAVGDGDVDVKKCIEVLKKAGYDGYVSIEYEGKDDCIDGIRRGYEYLKSII